MMSRKVIASYTSQEVKDAFKVLYIYIMDILVTHIGRPLKEKRQMAISMSKRCRAR